MWGNALKIANIAGIDIKIDASWILIATLIVWSLATGYFPAELPGARQTTLLVMSILAMIGLFASLILHELAHATVARWFGLRVPSITLFLFGGVAELQSEPASGKSEFWIAVAGPIASLGIGVTIWILARLGEFGNFPDPVSTVLTYLATLNFVIALFNLLPAFPMDGGRVLRAWLWLRTGDLLTATRRATAVAAVIAYMLMALGLFAAFSGVLIAGLWPILIGLFLLATSRGALARLETEAALGGRTLADLMTSDAQTVRPDQTLSDLVGNVFLKHAITFAPVVENGVLLGYVDMALVRGIDRDHWDMTTVEDIIESTTDENTLPKDMPATELITRIMLTGRRKFMVADASGLIGVITASDLLAYLGVARELGQRDFSAVGK